MVKSPTRVIQTLSLLEEGHGMAVATHGCSAIIEGLLQLGQLVDEVWIAAVAGDQALEQGHRILDPAVLAQFIEELTATPQLVLFASGAAQQLNQFGASREGRRLGQAHAALGPGDGQPQIVVGRSKTREIAHQFLAIGQLGLNRQFDQIKADASVLLAQGLHLGE